MMSDERRRRRSPESSRRSRRKARRDEREHPDTTLYSYPSQAQAQSQWASSSFQQTAESPLPPITMRTNDDARAIPIPSELNRPQRRRRSRHGSGSSSDFTYSSSGSSSSSYLDISRWYPSYGRAGGVLNAFFKTPSEHKPRRRRSRKLVKTKKTKAIFGFGNNSSSSSVNSDMAYGMGFIKKPKSRGGEFSPGYHTAVTAATGREASDARPSLPRRQTDEEILEIGRKLAQVAREQNQEDMRRLGKKPPSQFAATMSSWDKYRQSTSGQSTSGRGIAPSRSDRHHGYSSDDESEWESASEDEDSNGSSGLAYGLHHTPTPKPSAGRTSRPSTVIVSASPEERRILERKSSIVDPKLFGPVNSLRDFVNTPCGFGEDRGTYSVAGPGQDSHTGSAGTAESASAEARPLQTVYPIGTSDPGKMDAARDSGSIVTIQQNNYSTATPRDRVYSTVSTSNDRPDIVPIQAPKPIAPVPSRLYEDQRAHNHERSDSRERRRWSSDDMGERSDSRDRRHEFGDYETGRSDSRERRRNPGDSKIFAETALVGAGVAALGAAIMSNRDKGKGKEKDLKSNYGRDERYGHDDHRQDDTKVQDSRRAKELALEKEIERLEKALAGRNKAREMRKRESKRNSAPADLEKDYERERERRRGERSSKPGDTDGDVQPESSTRVSERREQAAVIHDTDYRHADEQRQPEPKGNVDVFQYQVSDDEFKTGTSPPKAPLPIIIDITPTPSPAPDQGRKGRRGSFEDEMHDARHIVEEASHSTAPIPEVAMAAAIAATEHSRYHKERGDEERGRTSSRADRDRVQEEANRYYHARRIAEREIRSRSRSSTPDRDSKPPRIVTPPEMKERPKVYDYSKPNADIIFDNELSPTELLSFLPREVPVRDPSAERPRPVLNLVLPTPVPTPSPEKEEKRRSSASRAPEIAEEERTRESPTVIIGPKGDIVQIVDAPEPREEVPEPPTPKSVSWGPSETKQYEVESPERSRERTPESPERTSRSGKKSSGGWGAIAAALASATAGAAVAREDDGKRSEGSRSPPKERPILPAGTSSRVMEEEPEELPPLPGPKPASPRSSQMPGAFADDLEFTANVAAGLQHAGFASDIVVEDPNFRRRDSPPGSNEPFTEVYMRPFSETVSDLGILGLDDGSKPVREPGCILGEVAEMPASEKAAAFDDTNFEHTSIEQPKLSKKEQRKLEKAAKAAKLAEEEQQAARPLEGGEDEWAEASTSKKSKKSKKSNRSSVSWDDDDTPVNDAYVSAPNETFHDTRETKLSNNEDDWDVPKRPKKSKRNSKGYDIASEDSPDRRERHGDTYEPLDRDVASVVSDSRYADRSNGHGRDDDRSVVSAPSSSDRKRDSKSEKRSSGSGFWSLLKGSNGVDTDDKDESKKDNAGTLGAGAGLAGAAVVATALAGGMAAARSDAAEAPSGQEEPHVGRDVDQSVGRTDSLSREVDVLEDPEIVPRVIKPAIDPQYGDLLPLPPSPGEKSSLDFVGDEDLPALPDSRPATPPGQGRALPRERSSSSQKRPGLTSHSRRTSTYETPLRSPSHTAVPIQFRMGHRPASTISPASGRPVGSGSPAVGRSSPTPQSPATSSGQEFSPTFKRTPRPTSWDNSKEFKPLYLLEQAGRTTRDSEEDLGDWPETTPLPPSRESPVAETRSETLEREVASETEDALLHIDAEATRALPLESKESTPKGTPAVEYNLPPSAGDEVTPYETPFEAPFGVASAASLPESSYATPVESPSQVIKEPSASGRQKLEHSANVFESDSRGSGQDLQVSSQPPDTVLEERQPQEEVAEAEHRKSYFPSAFSILPAATLAGVGALLGRGKHDEATTAPSEHAARANVEEQTEHLSALADQVDVKSARETDLGKQSGSTEQGAVSARKSPTDTTYSSAVDTADASVPNDPAAAAVLIYSEESLSQPSDAVARDAVDGGDESQIPTVAGTRDVLLPSSLPRNTETDLKKSTETSKTTEDMETIIETPADTIEWPMETVAAKKKRGKKGKKKQSVSDALQAPMDTGYTETATFEALKDPHVPEIQASKVIDEHILGTEPVIASDIIEAEAEPAPVASTPDIIGANVTEITGFGEVTGPSYPPESTDEQGLVNDPEELQAPAEASASPTMQDGQGVTTGDRPLKSSSGRRLRSSRVMSPHGSVDEYMSSDAIQSGDDVPASPGSGLRTTGKKYKKTRSLRSSRRSSAASQGSGQDNVNAEQHASEGVGESATIVPDVEQFRDATDEPLSSSPKVVYLPADAQVDNAEQTLSKETENVEEPAAYEAGVDLDPFQTETEAGAEVSDAPVPPVETRPLQYNEAIAEPMSLPEAQVDDDWAPTSSKKSKKNKKKKTQSISLAEDSWDIAAPEATAEKADPDTLDPVAPQESTLMIPGDHDQAPNLASDDLFGKGHSQSQAEPVETTAPLVSQKLAEDDLQPQSQAETGTLTEESTSLSHNTSEPQDILQSIQNEPTLAKEVTLEEQPTMQPTNDEPPVTVSEDLPSAQEVEPEPTPVSLEEEVPIVSKKSKTNKKKRKSSTVLDEAVRSSGTATPAELEQAGQGIDVQETSKLPVQEEVWLSTSDNLDNITAGKEEPKPVEASDVRQIEELWPVADGESTEHFVEAPVVREQNDLQQNLETRDIPQEPELELQSPKADDSRGGSARSPESATDKLDALESSARVEPETARNKIDQPTEPIEPTEAPAVSVPEEAAAEDILTEKLEEAEAPAQEEPQKEVGETDLRREAEAALVEEEEAEMARLQGKKKLKAKEKQRLRELKAKSEARAAEAEAIAMASAEEKVPVESALEAEVTKTPPNEQNFPIESLPETDIGGSSTAEAAVDSHPTEAVAPVLAPEQTTPIGAEEPLATGRDVPESATSIAQQPGLVSDVPLEDASILLSEQRAGAEPLPESTVQAAEDPEEIARREAEAEVIRQEESELARLKNKKKPNKKDKERIRVLRASAELRERDAEALQRQIEQQKAAAAAQEALEGTPVEVEGESGENLAAIKTSEVVSVEDVDSTQLEESTMPELETSALSQPEEQLPRDFESIGQEPSDTFTHTQSEGKVAVDMEDTTKAEIKGTVLDELETHTIEDKVGARQTVAEESIPLPESATGDVHDQSFQGKTEGHDSEDVAIQEAVDLPKVVPDQDQSHLPNDQTDPTESTTQQKSEADIVQDDSPQSIPEEPIVLPEYPLGEVREVGDRSQTEIVTEPDYLPPSEPDDGQALPKHDIEPPKEEITQPQVEEAVEPSVEPRTEFGSEPPGEAIPNSEAQDKEAHMVISEETPATAEVEPEPETEPFFTTKKSKKDKKKKRKGTISESSGQTSGIMTPAETLPTGETVLQSATEEASPLVDREIAPSQQAETTPPEHLEPTALPSVSNEESPILLEDEPTSSVQEAHVPLSDEQATQTPANAEDEALPIAATEVELESSPKEPEFTVSTKKSKKDKKKKRKGATSESSPRASGYVTSTDIDNALQESMPEALDRPEGPASTAEPESVPTIASDAPEQEQVLLQEEPSTILGEVEITAPVEASKDAEVEELREFDSGDHQVPVPTENVSLLPEYEQSDIATQAAENIARDEPQRLETEQANSPTTAKDSSPAGSSAVVEPEVIESPKDVAVQAKEISAHPDPQGEFLPPAAIEPEEVQADEFFVVPTKKSKKDKKKKHASEVLSGPAIDAETPVVEDAEPVSIDTTEAITDVQEAPTFSSENPKDEPVRDSQTPLDDWAPATSSKKSKKDKKKKKRASASLWEPESGAQTPLSQEPQDLQDSQKDADLVTQPAETLLQEPEAFSPRETAHIQDTTILPAANDESSKRLPAEPTNFIKPDSINTKKSGGWGLIAAAIGGGNSEPKDVDHSTLPVEPHEAEPAPEPRSVVSPQEDFKVDDALVTAEDKEEEPQLKIRSFSEPKSSVTKSMSGWGTIAAAVAGVTAGAAASSINKPERETNLQSALEDDASTSPLMAKPDVESKVNDGEETLIVAGGERAVVHEDPVSAPILKPDLEDNAKDGEETLIAAGGKTNLDDTEPWNFEAARDFQDESITKADLSEKSDDGNDNIIVAGERSFEEPMQGPQISDTREIVAEQENEFLDVDRSAVRPSSPVPWEDEDRRDVFATSSELPPVLAEEVEPMSTYTAKQTEPEPFEFVASKESKKDKKKKKRGSVSQSLELESEEPTPVEETPQFEEASEQQLPSASVETPVSAEPVDSDETKPADEEALDWVHKKMSKKEKRKAKKGSLSVSDPEAVVAMPDNNQRLTDIVTSPQNAEERADQLSSPRDDHATPVVEAQQDSALTKEPKAIDEPAGVGNEHPLNTETSSTQQQPEDPVVKSPIIEPVVDPSVEPKSAAPDEFVLEEIPAMTRKISKKEKRKAKKKTMSSWEEDILEPSESPEVATDPQILETQDPTTQPESVRDETLDVSSPTILQPTEIESGMPEAPVTEDIMAEEECAPLSRKKSKKDKKKKGKQRASEPTSGSQTPVTEEQSTSALPQTFEAPPTEPPVSEKLESSMEDQRHPVEGLPEFATEPQLPPTSIEPGHMESSNKKEQLGPSAGVGIDDWEESPERSEPTKPELGSPATLGAELQKMPSAAPSPDIWDDDDYFKPRQTDESRNSPNDKPIEKVDIHPAFSRELKTSPENRSKDERPLVGLGLIRRHSSIFQDDDGHTPKLLTLGSESFSVESLAVEETASPDDFTQKGVSKAIDKKPEAGSGKSLLEQRATPAPEDNGDSSSIQINTPSESDVFPVQYVTIPEPDDRQPTPTDPLTPHAPKPPPSPGLDDVSKMSKKGSVAMLAERFGGTTKKTTGKSKKVSKYVDKRTPQDNLFDEPVIWEGSERKPVEGSPLDLDAGNFWAVSDTDFDEVTVEPDTLAGQGATTSYGQETKTGDDNVSATHSPTSQDAGEFTPQVPEQASRAEEVPLESLVVESPVLGSQASFELSPREERIVIEPLDRPPDIDTGQTAGLPIITTELTPNEPGKEIHDLHTPRSLSPASDRGVRLDRTISPSDEADDYALQQGISPVSDLRRSISRGLPPVQEEPQEEEGEVGKHGISLSTGAGTPDINRDSGFVTGSPLPPRSRQFDDFQQQRDSGVHLRDYPQDTSPRLSSTRGLNADSNRISQSSLESEGAKLDDKPRRSPLAESPKRRQLGEGTPVLEAQETPVTPEPEKSRSPTRRSRKHYPDLGPEAAAASLSGGAALLGGAGPGAGRGATSPTPSLSSAASRRSISDKPEKRLLSGSSQPDTSSGQRRAASNTGIFRAKTPEPLNLRPESPNLLRYSGTPPLRSRRTRSGDLRSLSQLSNRSHSDVSALLQASPSPVSGAVDPANPVNPANTPGPASSSSSSDLRRPTATPAAAQAPHQKNSNNNHTPLANEGRVRSKDMADVYDGFGEGRLGSPRSPTRPHSMRRRQSMQVLELESRVEQLIAENRALSEARQHAEQHSTNRATSTIAERDNEIESLKQSLDFMRKEIQRLTEVNEGLNSAIAQSAVQHEDRYRMLETQHADATRELNVFRGRHSSSSKSIEEKDAEIRDLREQLEATKEQIRDMQRQILATKPADSDFLRIKDVDYFDHRCQQLCSHVQQWVLRFSKFSDMRACRLTSELNDEKIIDRLDNAVLDGSNVDNYLNDRVRRRDIFMSLAMTMIWEFVFTRYLFGMDREQRQKLKALEKLLLEVGPPHAVRQWRAVTLTLLSRRESFNAQRDQDTEAVVQAVFQTLCMILPPPSNLEDQIQNQLRKVMREAVDLSIEMRTQRAEYMMLPPLQPEYDANGDLAEPHPFNATLMNERSGDKSVDNDDLQAQGSIVRVVLFPLVVKKGDDDGVGDDEVVVCPAQVIVARPRSSSRRSMRAPSSDAGGVSLLRGASPSTALNKSNVSMAEAEYLEGGI